MTGEAMLIPGFNPSKPPRRSGEPGGITLRRHLNALRPARVW